MTSFWTPFYFLSVIATGIVYLLVFVVALQRWRDYPRPSKYLMISVLLVVLSYVMSTAVTMFVANTMTPTTMGGAMVIVSLGRTALHVFSFGFMVAAVYVDRVPTRHAKRDEFLPGDQKPAAASPNPFVSPE